MAGLLIDPQQRDLAGTLVVGDTDGGCIAGRGADLLYEVAEGLEADHPVDARSGQSGGTGLDAVSRPARVALAGGAVAGSLGRASLIATSPPDSSAGWIVAASAATSPLAAGVGPADASAPAAEALAGYATQQLHVTRPSAAAACCGTIMVVARWAADRTRESS